MNTFSERHGFEPEQPPISVREDAPHELRGVLADIGYESGYDPHSLRSLVTRVLRVRENPGNWSAFPNVDGEVRDLLDSCEWYEVYDVIEHMSRQLRTWSETGRRGTADPAKVATELNRYLKRRGIGWVLTADTVEVRGEDEFEAAVKHAPEILEAAGRPTAAQGRRPVNPCFRDER